MTYSLKEVFKKIAVQYPLDISQFPERTYVCKNPWSGKKTYQICMIYIYKHTVFNGITESNYLWKP